MVMFVDATGASSDEPVTQYRTKPSSVAPKLPSRAVSLGASTLSESPIFAMSATDGALFFQPAGIIRIEMWWRWNDALRQRIRTDFPGDDTTTRR